MKQLTVEEQEKLRVSFSQKIAETKVSEINYEQYLVACILTAQGPDLVMSDVISAIHAAGLVISEMANQQVAHEVING